MKSTVQQRRSYSKKLRSKATLSKRVLINKTGRHIYLILVDDDNRCVLHNFSTLAFASGDKNKNFCNINYGKMLAEKAGECFKATLSGEKALFDRRKQKYHGIVREVAETLRRHDVIS